MAGIRTRRSICVVVDGYSTGAALAQVFTGYGYDTVHVRSGPYIPDVLTRSFRPEDYVERYEVGDDPDRLCAQLTAGERQVLCVVAGAETGVLVADLLSERLGCPSNGTALSPARRDKRVMSATVARAGLATISQLCSGDPAEILNWVAEHQLDQVVLKPPASSGTYGVHLCDGAEEVSRTLEHLLGSRDIFDAAVDRVVVQPYLTGVEFCVNAVSREGRHLVSDIWLTRKRRCGPANVYDLETLLSPDHPDHPRLSEYVGGVLDALGIRFGPTHTEVMLTDGGPVLIESAARLMGSLDLALVTAATGTNAVLLTAEAYLTPHRFDQRLSALTTVPALVRRAGMVQMIAVEGGKLGKYRLDELTRLPSFHGVDTYLSHGDEVLVTVNSYTSPGLIFLSADTEQQLRTDHSRIRELERGGALYQLA